MKVFTVKKNDLENNLRLEPNFYYYKDIVFNELKSKNISFQKLGDLAIEISDGEHSHIPRTVSKGIRYLYGRNIKFGVVNFDPITDLPYISEKNYLKNKRIHLQEDDVLLTIVGTVGKSAIYKKSYIGEAGIPRHIARIKIKDNNNISPEYISSFLRSKIGKIQLKSMTTGNIQPFLSLKSIAKIKVPVLSDKLIDEITNFEKRIINCEIKSNKLINEAQKLFYDSTEFKQINQQNDDYWNLNLNNLDVEGLWIPEYSNPENLKYINHIEKKFNCYQLSDIAEISKGSEVGSDNYIEYENSDVEDIPFIRTSDFVNNDTDIFPDFFVNKDLFKEVNHGLKDNDVLYSKDGKIGEVSMVTKANNLIIGSGIVNLRVKESIKKNTSFTNEYLFLLLSIPEIGLIESKEEQYLPALSRI